MSGEYGSLFEMLDKRLDSIESTVNETKTDTAVIKDRQCTLIEEISSIKSEIYGNGKNGLKTEIALLWQKIRTTSGTVGAITGGIVAVIVAIVISKLGGK